MTFPSQLGYICLVIRMPLHDKQSVKASLPLTCRNMRTLCSCSPRVMGAVAMYVQLPIHLYRLNAASLSGITYRALGQKQGKMATKRSSQNFTSSPTASLFGFGRSKGKKLPELVQAGDPVLHEPAAEVPLVDIGSERVQNVINDMIAVMRNAPGVGLAAPQIGVPLKIIVLEDKQEYLDLAPTEEIRLQERLPFDLLVIINPKLKRKGRRSARFFEGCLSVNGYRGLVERDLDVEVSGIGRDGLPIKVEASGWQARILQHECDHLDGLIYVDKIIQRSFRIVENLRLPLPSGCPRPGICAENIIV